MILDSATQLLTAYAPTTNGAAQWNNTYIDLLAKQVLGAGNTLTWLVSVKVTATSLGSATVLHKLETNPTDATFASGNILLAQLPNTGTGTAVASVIAGFQQTTKIPRAAVGRYVRHTVTIGTADLVLGQFDAWLLNDDLQDNQPYAAGYTVA